MAPFELLTILASLFYKFEQDTLKRQAYYFLFYNNMFNRVLDIFEYWLNHCFADLHGVFMLQKYENVYLLTKFVMHNQLEKLGKILQIKV